MSYYETVFIARPDLSEKQVQELTEAMTKIVTDNGGKIHKTEYWGLKTLAYRINKNRKGHYTLIEMDAPAATSIELERNLRLNEDVLRSQTLRLEELTDGPSVMVAREDRDEKEAA